VHADQQRGADRQAVVADLRNYRRRNFQRARQRSVILQAQVFDDSFIPILGFAELAGGVSTPGEHF
jgi:hypothetical protein